jgi:hypothetical protein
MAIAGIFDCYTLNHRKHTESVHGLNNGKSLKYCVKLFPQTLILSEGKIYSISRSHG